MGNGQEAGRVVGRYVLYDEIASGGMATIHLGRMIGQVGFARTVAIKRLHPHFAKDPEFVAMFIDEARLAAGIRHPNVVSTLDVVALEGDLFLVMEYVEGDSLSHLVKRVHTRDQRIPPGVVSGIVSNVLYGLHAAHTAMDERGEALSIVHRDVSPQNILVGVDGVARVVDFGVAKAARRIMETEAGRIKGKFRYMAPEQVRADKVDHRVDVFAAGIVLWEALVGRGLFVADEPMRTMSLVLEHPIPPPSSLVPGILPDVDAVVAKALSRNLAERYASAREMAIDLENALPPAVPRVIGEWVDGLVGDALKQRAARLIELGSETSAAAAASVAAPAVPAPAVPAPAVPAPSVTAPSVTPPPAEAPAAPPPEVAAPPPPVAAPFVAPAPALAPEPAREAAPVAVEPAPAVAPRTEPSSQVSEVSTAAWDTAAQRSLFPHKSKQLKIVVASVVGAAALFFLVGLVVMTARGKADSEPDVVQVLPTGVQQPAAAKPPQPVAEPPVAPAPEPVLPAPKAKDPEPPPPVAAAPPPKAIGSEPAKAAAPKPAPAAAADVAAPKPPAPKPAGDCNPPWVIDASGIKKFKRHCL
ncbi:MAG: serine/threonine protein kinase [Polyangiaceae bacterium]|nr:serine/threonine protein kinase [Polyangiaceae bacterium]